MVLTAATLLLLSSAHENLSFVFLACASGGGARGAARLRSDDGSDSALADTEVLIDKMGVPHIYAASDRDAMFASGYVMAAAAVPA